MDLNGLTFSLISLALQLLSTTFIFKKLAHFGRILFLCRNSLWINCLSGFSSLQLPQCTLLFSWIGLSGLTFSIEFDRNLPSIIIAWAQIQVSNQKKHGFKIRIRRSCNVYLDSRNSSRLTPFFPFIKKYDQPCPSGSWKYYQKSWKLQRFWIIIHINSIFSVIDLW